MPTRLAVVHGVVGLTTCLFLILLYLNVEVFGPVNDVGNAVFGLLSLALARALPSSSFGRALAAAGALSTVVGSVLVLSGATGFYLSGFVSSLGFALIGAWLVGFTRRTTGLPRGGTVAGAVMLLGLIGVPAIAMGIHDLDTAPAWTFVAGASWAGTYLLFPIWSLRLAAGNKP
jgi:hypothetical protein